MTTPNDKFSGKIRVLAVDDDPNVTWILSDGLSEHGFIVEICNDGRAAVNKFNQFHPEVCLLDIKMPGMDGIQLLNYIKKEDPTISVIIISGHADTPIVVQAVQGKCVSTAARTSSNQAARWSGELVMTGEKLRR